MKIYFAGSIRGGRQDAKLYEQLIDYLKAFAEVLTEHVGDAALTSAGDDGPDDQFIHDRDLDWLKEADAVVAEVTTVSMGVGYEIGRAVEMKKPVLCLFRNANNKRLSAMISGCNELEVIYYTGFNEAKDAIKNFLKKH
ncbi:nucleoside 2-deoxyribosyltransferase [uncultured Draconibacterium sp.]|uniref:nucleoside 2-deoxyribosyltransferase n=1 Tax=uncultured Draconibacterium sp. TaxID=1573823 RepID=UPI0025E71CF5|nr:nucleoside 2-deoxyribosyltransferase [uncultured Draconibacterium sp.]